MSGEPPARSSTELAAERTTLADARTGLAVTRTIVALDRTLMAWVRTATSLISFGFTIYKFFQALPAAQVEQQSRVLGPRGVALVMIALGVGGLALAMLEYRKQLRSLHERFKAYGPFHSSVASGVASAIAGLGIIGFVLVFLRQ